MKVEENWNLTNIEQNVWKYLIYVDKYQIWMRICFSLSMLKTSQNDSMALASLLSEYILIVLWI